MAENGNIQAASECYDAAIVADPKYAASFFNKGVLLDKLQERELALTVLEKAISIDPRKPNAMVYKGIVLGN